MTDAQFLAWLQDSAAARMVLIEAQVNVAGVEVTRYIASRLRAAHRATGAAHRHRLRQGQRPVHRS